MIDYAHHAGSLKVNPERARAGLEADHAALREMSTETLFNFIDDETLAAAHIAANQAKAAARYDAAEEKDSSNDSSSDDSDDEICRQHAAYASGNYASLYASGEYESLFPVSGDW